MPLGSLSGLFGHELALDPGSRTCRVLGRAGAVLAVPSLVARVEPGRLPFLRTEAVGREAEAIMRRAHREGADGVGLPGVVLTRPIVRGAIADPAAAERLFSFICAAAPGRSWGTKPSVLCGIGSGLTAVEQRTLVDVLDRAGAKRIRLVSSLAACVLALEREGTVEQGAVRLVVELGAERIAIGVASRAGVLSSTGLPMGACDLDRIVAGRLGRLGFTPTPAQAAALREGLGLPADEPAALCGTQDRAPLSDLEDVLPRHVGEALEPFLLYIADEIRGVMSRAPAGAAPDLVGGGVVLAGAPALTPGIAAFFSRDLGISVTVAPDPATLRVRGLAGYLDEPELLEEVGVEA